MIRINLLPVRASKKRELGKQWLALFTIVFIASVAGNYFWYARKEETLAKVRAMTAKYRADNAELQKIIGEVNDIKKQREDIENKLKILRDMRARRVGPVKMMDELTFVLPPKVWIVNLEEKGGTVTITGSGATLEDVATFMKKLKTPDKRKDGKPAPQIFSDPVLKGSRVSGENKVDFTITCSVKYS